jgi:hypothetical protein
MKTFTISLTTARRTITIALVIVSLGLLVLSGWTNPMAQRNKKTIIQHLTILKYPVELSFKFEGQALESTETVFQNEGIRTNEFDADSDWLKDFTISVKNVSAKTITYLNVNLMFPEVTWHGRSALHQFFFGVDKDKKFPRPDLRLAPNESLEIPVAAGLDDIKTMAKMSESGVPVENVSKVLVEFHAALFDDETFFEAGQMWRRNPDPNDPQKWIRIKEK